ncbi:hypothetical protein [Paenibacillus xanthanilyticus]
MDHNNLKPDDQEQAGSAQETELTDLPEELDETERQNVQGGGRRRGPLS